jgi:hypothetical protein
MNPMNHMQTTYKQVQIPRNVKLFIRVVNLIAQTQGYQQNKQVQLAQTQRNNFQRHHTRFTNTNNDTAVNISTCPENRALLVAQCLTPILQTPTTSKQLHTARTRVSTQV